LLTEGSTPHRQPGCVEVEDALRLLNDEDALVPAAVRSEIPSIARAVRFAEASLRAGGRLIYAGAGTSGRLGCLDAAEIPPTFGMEPGVVIGVIAGGDRALQESMEGAEDAPEAGAAAVAALEVSDRDTVIGEAHRCATPSAAPPRRRRRRVRPLALADHGVSIRDLEGRDRRRAGLGASSAPSIDSCRARSPPAMTPMTTPGSMPNVGGISAASRHPRRPLVPRPAVDQSPARAEGGLGEPHSTGDRRDLGAHGGRYQSVLVVEQPQGIFDFDGIQAAGAGVDPFGQQGIKR